MVLQQAAADADESHARQPEQNTGGSDALCLGALPVQGNLGIDGIQGVIQANQGKYQKIHLGGLGEIGLNDDDTISPLPVARFEFYCLVVTS